MNLNNFTIKAQETIARSQQLAFDGGNPVIETEHLLKALLEEEDSLVEWLLKKSNVNVNFVEGKLAEGLNKLPKAGGGEPAQSMSRELNNVLLRAPSTLKPFGDEFVSPEHIHEVATPVIAHRLVLEPQAKFSGMTTRQVMDEILKRVPVPA